MRAVLVGAVESTKIACDALIRAAGWELAMIVTLEDGLAHRHSDYADLAGVAKLAGAKLLKVRNINDATNVEKIAAVKPDVIFVIGWSQICGPEFMAISAGNIIGYHPAALPRLRGRAAIPWTILNREVITAGSLFFINEAVDDGAILDQQYFHLDDDETVTTLYARHMHALTQMMDRTLPKLRDDTAEPVEQNARYATWGAKRGPDDGIIDWTQNMDDILRLIRAVTRPYPGAIARQGDKSWSIFSARMDDRSGKYLAVPGQIVRYMPGGFSVQCGDGAICITDWHGSDGDPPKIHSRFN